MNPSIICIYGNIGAGKTTIAVSLANSLKINLLLYDEEMWKVFPNQKLYGDKEGLNMTLNQIMAVYDHILNKALALIKGSKSVIIEAMYSDIARQAVIDVCTNQKIQFILIEVKCSDDVAKRRITARKRANPQTAGYDLHEGYKKLFSEEKNSHLTIDSTTKTPQECIIIAKNYIQDIGENNI